MSITALRSGSYPGSDIVIVKELTAAASYHRYYAFYLSQSLKIYGLLTVPNGDPPAGGWPAIVFNHGYIPPTQYVTTERYVAYVDYLARAGYVVYKIDYRGNGNSDGIARGAYGDPGYTIDVLNAISSLQKFPQVNPQKIGMWGHSMGGYLTLRAMVISQAVKVGVIWAGVVGSYPDLVNIWHHSDLATPTAQPNSPNWKHRWFDQHGSPQEDPQFWDSISATSYLADLSGPLQLHHDTQDSEVPYVFSETLAKDIQNVGGTVEFYSYPGDDHNLANSFGLAMSRTIAFFDKYLK
jgi:dipeptidyl aminopeptidase/acylaminoacyl peptidase